jgi:hypothetical protein
MRSAIKWSAAGYMRPIASQHSLTMAELAEFKSAAHAIPELDEIAESPDLASLAL